MLPDREAKNPMDWINVNHKDTKDTKNYEHRHPMLLRALCVFVVQFYFFIRRFRVRLTISSIGGS